MPPTTSQNRLQQYFLLGLLFTTMIVMFLILRPFFAPLVLALSLGITFLPMHRRITKMFGARYGISAFFSVFIVLLVVVIPIALISFLLFHEAALLYNSITNDSTSTLSFVSERLNNGVGRFFPGFKVNISEYLQSILRWTVDNLGLLFSKFFNIFLETMLLLLTLFYFFKNSVHFRFRLSQLSPLQNEYDKKIIDRMTLAVNSIIRGSIIVGILQGIFATVGLWLFGVPSALIWGVSAGIVSLVPGVGTVLVMGPAIIWLFGFGSTVHGVGLFIWYICSLVLIDNILSPHIIEHGMKIHSLFVLISILGGLVVFGPIGILLGPITLAFFFALIEIYPLIFK